MSNLDLWNAVERTDPKHTKAIVGKAYKGNSPKPYYLVHKATETFGPCGIGWGFEIVEEKLLDGALIAPGFYERIHMARVRIWYEWGGKRGSVEHVGETLFSGKRRDGNTFTDEDAPKKSVTDALVKALSMIGFAGDIFMGRFDDSKYVSDLNQELRSEEAAKNGNGKRTRADIQANAARKKREHSSIATDLSQITSLRELERYKAETLTPDFMAGLGIGQYGIEEMVGQREAELQEAAEDLSQITSEVDDPSPIQVHDFNESREWLQGAKDAADLEKRGKNEGYTTAIKGLTVSQRNDLRSVYKGLLKDFAPNILAAG